MATQQEVTKNIPSDAFEYNGHYYKIYSSSWDWDTDEAYCESLGGHLVTITDAKEKSAVEYLIGLDEKKLNATLLQPESAYLIGGYKDSDNQWKWVNGEKWDYNPDQNDYDGYWVTGNKLVYNNPRYGRFYRFRLVCEWDDESEEEPEVDEEITIDSETTLEVINLFAGLSSAEKKETLQENLQSLQQLKPLLEGEKNVEIVDKTTGKIVKTDVQNIVRLIGTYFGLKSPEWLTKMTKWTRDGDLKIFYAKDGDGVEILNAKGEKIKIEDPNMGFVASSVGAIFDIGTIINTSDKIVRGNLSGATLLSEVSKLNASILSLTDDIKKIGGKNIPLISISSSVLGWAGSILALCDGVEPKEIVDACSKTLGTATTIVKKFSTDFTLKYTSLGQKITDNVWAQKLSANSLKASLIMAGALGVFMGGVQYFESEEKYQIDGLEDSLAAKNKWIDVFGTSIKTFVNTITLGLDDVVFATFVEAKAGFQWLWTKMTGGDTSQLKLDTTEGKNYMEMLGDVVKRIALNQITGSKNDDYIKNEEPKAKIVSAAGNDYISNFASSVQVYSGVGEDTIFCHENTKENYIDGGNDNDKIFVHGNSNEVHGGLGNDSIWALGDSKNLVSGNLLQGDAGNDVILIDDSNAPKKSGAANTIVGGADNDVLILENTRTANVISYANGDGDDVIFGYDTNDTIEINKSDYTTVTSGDNVKIIVGEGSMTLIDAATKKINISKTDTDIFPIGVTAKLDTLSVSNKFRGGIIYMDNFSHDFTGVNASKLAKTQPIQIVGNSSGKANYIKGGKGNDTLSGGTGRNYIYGGDGDDIISGGADNDLLKGDAGNDIISGGAGNDTLYGGNGNDIFVYDGGDDVIYDYKPAQDKIKLSNVLITDSFLNGSHVVLQTTNGSLTVRNAKNKKITLVDSSGNETTDVYPISTLPAGISIKNSILTASSKFRDSEIDLADYPTVTKVNASAVSQPLKIIGGSENNSIKGGKGADLIYGGAGSDTVSLGGGADTYVYSYGNDLIYDYAPNQDVIKLDGNTITGSQLSGNNVILQTYGGSITVRNGKNKKITVIDSDGNETSKIYPIDNLPENLSLNNSTLTAGAAFAEEKIDLGKYSCVKTVKATAVQSDLYIIGNDNNNSLRGGKGTSSLWGGASTSDDTLYGGTSNVFIYGKNEGNDIIRNAKNTDVVQLYNVNFSDLDFSVVNSKMILAVENGTLTIESKKTPIIQTADGSSHQYDYKTRQWNSL